ncbi:MAG: hypothetical protein WKF35_06725 [Ferruginibacter sp.]
MKSITKDYLADIIFRIINKTISLHRSSQNNYLYHEHFPSATDAEVLDFIQSIPWFDLKLKNFIVGNLAEETIIISQSWELEFFKRVQAWSESNTWLQYNNSILHNSMPEDSAGNFSLTLPY